MVAEGNGDSYNCCSIATADGYIFLPGRASKGTCIFVVRCSPQRPWSTKYLGSDQNVAMIMTTRKLASDLPLLIVSYDDSSLVVWRYHAFEDASSTFLSPYCRLNHGDLVSASDCIRLPANTNDNDTDCETLGICQNMAVHRVVKTSTPLLMLAVCFERGFVIYVLPSPVANNSGDARKSNTTFPDFVAPSASPSVSPLSVKRWVGSCDNSSVAWTNLGPYSDLCLSFLLEQQGQTMILVGHALYPSWYSPSLLSKKYLDFYPLYIGAAGDPTAKSNSAMPALFPCAGEFGVVYASKGILFKAPIDCLATGPIASAPFGLSSDGSELASDIPSSEEFLHVVAVVQFESKHTNKLNQLFYPIIQFWLCATTMQNVATGSSLQTEVEIEEFAAVGSRLVCELANESLNGLRPRSLARCPGLPVCAVAFGPAMQDEYQAQCATKVALVDFRSTPRIYILDGRDIAFMPSETELINGFVLSTDGTSQVFFSLRESSLDISHDSACRPLLGTDAREKYVDCERVFLFQGNGKVNLGVLGRRLVDRTRCFAVGTLCETASINADSWRKLLPNMTFAVVTFEPDEMVISAVGLQPDSEGFRNFCIATSTRVMIVSSSLEIVAEVQHDTRSTSPTPIGSFSVSYVTGHQIRYLSCLPSKMGSGLIGSVPKDKGVSDHILAAIRQDRSISLLCTKEYRFLDANGEQTDDVLMNCPRIKPCFVLEPLLSNACCIAEVQTAKDGPLIHDLIGKFGRFPTPLVHSAGEGVGPSEGVSASCLTMLNSMGHTTAARWILTKNSQFTRSSASHISLPAIPVGVKGACADADEFLHVIADGDNDLTEYVKSPETRTPVTLHACSSPHSYLSEEYAHVSLERGQGNGALKIFDMAGRNRSELALFQVASVPCTTESPSYRESAVQQLVSNGISGRSVTNAMFRLSHMNGDTPIYPGEGDFSLSSQRCYTTGRGRHELLPASLGDSPSHATGAPETPQHFW